MRNRVIVLASVAVVGILLIGILIGRKDRQATVRIAYPPIVASLPVFIAEERQLFTQKEVDAELIQFTNSNDMVNALVGGQIDLLPAVSLVPLIHLEVQFPGTVRVFSHSRMTRERAFDSIITLQNSPVGELKDLEGRKIGVFPGTSATRAAIIGYTQGTFVCAGRRSPRVRSIENERDPLAEKKHGKAFNPQGLTASARAHKYRVIHQRHACDCVTPSTERSDRSAGDATPGHRRDDHPVPWGAGAGHRQAGGTLFERLLKPLISALSHMCRMRQRKHAPNGT